MQAIACRGLVKEYGAHDKLIKAIDDITFEVGKGETFGLLGPNGAGKTTLVKVLATLLKLTRGTAEVGGYDVDGNEDAIRHIVGYAGQDSERSAYFRLTVMENLLYFAHALRDVPINIARERIERIASAIGFEDRLNKHFIILSGGEKQLVVVIRAIVHEPEICFLDEPSKSLDPLTARRVRDFLKSYAEEKGMTICLTTHNMKEAEEFCDRIAFIHRGKLRFVGTSREFKKHVIIKEVVEIDAPRLDANIEAKLTRIPGIRDMVHDVNIKLYCDDAFDALGQVMAIFGEAGIKVPVSMVEPSLEDAFAFFVGGEEEGGHD